MKRKLNDMRKDNVAKEKQQKEAARALEQIEAVSVLQENLSFDLLLYLFSSFVDVFTTSYTHG